MDPLASHVAGDFAAAVRFKKSPMILPPILASSGHRSRPSLEIHWKKAALAWDRRASSIDTELGEFIGNEDDDEEGGDLAKEDVSSSMPRYHDDEDKDEDCSGNRNLINDHGSIKSDVAGGEGGPGGGEGGDVLDEELAPPKKKKKRALRKRGSVSVVTPFKGSRVLI